MKFQFVPVCFIPSRVVIVDDNISYLNGLEDALASDFNVMAFSDPKVALKMLQDDYRSNPYIDHCRIDQEEVDPDQGQVTIDLRTIHKTFYHSDRFDEISVVVIDYAMPGMDGVTFCEGVSDLPMKKILLTGEAGNDLAVKAFNEGVIHKFITKTEDELVDVLVDVINDFQRQYYHRLSEQLIQQCGPLVQEQLRFLHDEAFVNYFNHICQVHNISEFYLTDRHGGFLMISKDGVPSWLAVGSDESFDEYLDIARAGEDVPVDVLSALEECDQLPYFFSNEDYNAPPSQWAHYMHPIEKLVTANGSLYVAYVSGGGVYHL